ncbi:KAR9-domain-containing protein [Dothidotthia symphoricarpi CBS 119687]|uniref:KAR9-domain-containing protein n=1 Tax=Dothidotthia symphoricarpi CBS 119687 TaxID=1392245 RepID=A0A6A6AU50_9PLEO|nr:KAR9-domain-containing protein [Dothidotthia symphoricarpi CBS 119687]KAF2134367.1 KAR9-domain-containing protein [Dothidotthia symphoricarpi CBS 119687]
MSSSSPPPLVNSNPASGELARPPPTRQDPPPTPPSARTAPTSPRQSPSSNVLDRSNSTSSSSSGRKLARNVAPGLLARMKFLNQGADSKTTTATPAIGRISEHKIRHLDEFHKDRNVRIERRGTAWNGTTASQAGTPLIPQLTGESVPALHMEPDIESDYSDVTKSDRVLPEEGERHGLDVQAYKLPDVAADAAKELPDVDVITSTTATTITPPPPTPPTTSIAADMSRPPTPPPKDTPPLEEVSVLDDVNGIDVAAYFSRRHHLHRTNSVYTLSKASFTNQIQQLTSMKLPPTTIASEITALPSSTLAGRALHKAANDIRLWMTKATEVLEGLDAEDDVEWAAAAGREGLAEVDSAISKFEGLITVYITAIEDLQSRPDIALLPARDQETLVSQMEDVVNNWSEIKKTLRGIKNQVEVAMEWEELWNTVLGEIGLEVENLSRLVFEMEERRHRVISDSVAESAEKFDIAELETIVEELPRQAKILSHRFSMPPTLAVLSPTSPIPLIEQENTKLLALFAKLQPLRASLDFLPMRLASFQHRAGNIFPSACEELMERKEQLEQQEKQLEAEADALREELGEDKWVHSFRQAGSKAVAMYDSCIKSIQRLRQAIDEGDDEKLTSRIATYKDKRDHYPPSMKRVLELIDIEMKHRSTVNGEILRIQQDVRQKVSHLETETTDMDALLDEFKASRKLRDSVSTVLSARTEASLSGSAVDTPNSSPASSIIMSRKSSDYDTTTLSGKKVRQAPGTASKPLNRRYSSMPIGMSPAPRKSLQPTTHLQPPAPSRTTYHTPVRAAREITPPPDRPANRPSNKPRWNSSTNMSDTVGPSTPAKNSHSMPTTPLSASHTPAGTPSSSRRVSIAPQDHDARDESPVPRRASRPTSAMNARRSSMMLPAPRTQMRTSSALSVSPAQGGGLGSIDEGRKSRGSGGARGDGNGRQSSAGERRVWK